MGNRMIVGPLPCRDCRAQVRWWFIDGMWRLRDAGTDSAHRCAA